jgi:coatomer protein complex subunit gamma
VLAVRILHLLGKEGPKAKNPSKYIRYIYNRVILEHAPVRAAAVSALAQFAAYCPNLLTNVVVLLKVCLYILFLLMKNWKHNSDIL